MSIRFVDPPTTCTVCTPSVKIFLIIVKLSREECCAHFYTYIYVRTVYIMYYSFPSFCFLSYPFFFFQGNSATKSMIRGYWDREQGVFEKTLSTVDRFIKSRWLGVKREWFSFWMFSNFSQFSGNDQI